VNGNATVGKTGVLSGDAEIKAEVSAEGVSTPFTLRLTVPEPNQLAAVLSSDLAEGTGRIDLASGNFETEGSVASRKLASIDPLLRSFGLQQLPVEGTGGLTWNVVGSPSELVAKVSVNLVSEGTNLAVNLEIQDERLTLDGQAVRPELEPIEIRAEMGIHPQVWSRDPDSFRTEPIEVSLRAPSTDLGFVRDFAPWIPELAGQASADLGVSGTFDSPVITGNLTAKASALRFQSEAAPPLSEIAIQLKFVDDRLTIETFQGKVADNAVFVLAGDVKLPSWDRAKFDLTLSSPENTATVAGEVDLSGKTYSGELVATLKSLVDFGLPLTGGAEFKWKGGGGADGHSGSGELGLEELSIAEGPPVSGSLSGDYAPDSFAIPEFRFETEDLTLTGKAGFENRRLRLENLQLLAGEQKLASANVSIPFDPATPFWQQAEAVEVEAESNDLRLEQLLVLIGVDPSIRGVLNGKLTASGPLGALQAEGTIRLTEGMVGGYDDSSFDVSLDLGVADGKLTIDGQATHGEFSPILIRGSMDFHPETWSREPKAMFSEPLVATVAATDLNLDKLRAHLPSIRQAEGKATVNLEAGGTIGAPNLTGRILVGAPRIRFVRQEIPTLTDIRIQLDFDGESMAITEFRGEIAGGPFELTGKVGLQKIASPEFDLRLTARETLIARTEDLNLRANGNVSLKGSWKSAALTGQLLIAQSRYSKEIEILPLGMLTTKRLPAAATPDKVPLLDVKKSRPPGLHVAPFEDWTLDMRIAAEEPFLVRGNLATADIVGDLKLTGTLGAPVAAGKIELAQARATLPFSQLKSLPGAALTFTPESGLFNPAVSFRGESVVGNYRVEIHVFGTVRKPEYILSSQPPLVESEIVSLLATGSTSSELQDGGVVASKAAILVLQDAFRRVGRKVMPGAAENNEYAELLREKVEVSVDTIDVGTGRFRSETAVKLTENVHIVGSLDESGNSRGLLKFIIRLR
jgi:hypothetical protein